MYLHRIQTSKRLFYQFLFFGYIHRLDTVRKEGRPGQKKAKKVNRRKEKKVTFENVMFEKKKSNSHEICRKFCFKNSES